MSNHIFWFIDSDLFSARTTTADALPYLGLLVQQGYDSLGDGHFGGECLLAFEPTTGIGDDIPTCIRTNTQVVLPAGSDWSFWIRISVERL